MTVLLFCSGSLPAEDLADGEGGFETLSWKIVHLSNLIRAGRRFRPGVCGNAAAAEDGQCVCGYYMGRQFQYDYEG